MARIRLWHLAPAPRQEQGDCAAAFYAPLHRAEHVVERPARFQGHDYRLLTTPHGSGLQLPVADPAAAGVNVYARDWLAQQTRRAYEFAACGGGRDGRIRLHPLRWDSAWLVLQEDRSDGFCASDGGTVDGGGFVVFDARSGRRADTWGWVRGGDQAMLDHAPDLPSPNRLRRWLEAHSPAQGCEASQALLSAPYPTPDGLVFAASQGRHGDLCLAHILLPWRQAGPLLTPAGQAAMARSLAPAPRAE